MRSKELFLVLFKIEGIIACLLTDGNDSVEKERLVMQRREMRLTGMLPLSGIQGRSGEINIS